MRVVVCERARARAARLREAAAVRLNSLFASARARGVVRVWGMMCTVRAAGCHELRLACRGARLEACSRAEGAAQIRCLIVPAHQDADHGWAQLWSFLQQLQHRIGHQGRNRSLNRRLALVGTVFNTEQLQGVVMHGQNMKKAGSSHTVRYLPGTPLVVCLCACVCESVCEYGCV